MNAGPTKKNGDALRNPGKPDEGTSRVVPGELTSNSADNAEGSNKSCT